RNMIRKLTLAVVCSTLAISTSYGDITLDFQTNANSLTATPGAAAFSTFGMGNFATLTQSGVTLTVEAIGGDQSNTASGSPEPIGVNGSNPVGDFYGDGDAASLGIGVRGTGSWAINGNSNEALSLSFSDTVMINSIDLNGIGNAPNNNDRAIVTIGSFVIDVFGNNTVTGTPPAGTTFNGFDFDVISFATPITLNAGDTILLEGPNAGSGSFSLRGLNVTIPTAIPEPSACAVIAVIGICFTGRRRQ
ncbi:MAG: hypothetical protein AAGA30_16480, partial [Planctomycetota bacterium]